LANGITASMCDPITQAGRNIVGGPEVQQGDFSALKNFRCAYSRNIQFRSTFSIMRTLLAGGI